MDTPGGKQLSLQRFAAATATWRLFTPTWEPTIVVKWKYGASIVGVDGVVGGLAVSMNGLVVRMVAFVRAGYPHKAPETDYIPLVALLRRRLSDDEVTAVVADVVRRGDLSIDIADIGVTF